VRIPPQIAPWNSRAARAVWYSFTGLVVGFATLGGAIGMVADYPRRYTFVEAVAALHDFTPGMLRTAFDWPGHWIVHVVTPLVIVSTSVAIARSLKRHERSFILCVGFLWVIWPIHVAPSEINRAPLQGIQALVSQEYGEFYQEFGLESTFYLAWCEMTALLLLAKQTHPIAVRAC